MSRGKRSTIDYQLRNICADAHKSNFFRVYSDLFFSSAFRSLSKNAQLLYVAMGIESRGNTVFKFPHSAYIRIMSKDGFEAAKKQLVECGFITEKRFRTVANEYSFSGEWKEKSMLTVRSADK